MAELPLPIVRGKRAQQPSPAAMQILVQREGHLYRRGLTVGEFRPPSFVVWLYGWLVFSERQLVTHVRVHVAVGHVVDHLPHRPATVAVGSVELLRRQSRNGSAHVSGRVFDLCDHGGAVCLAHSHGKAEFADWESWVGHLVFSIVNLLRAGTACE